MCASYRQQAYGSTNSSPAQRARRNQGLVKFAKCMRAHTINIPDPTGGGFLHQIPSSEVNTPACRSALHACRTDLPPEPGHGG